MILHTWTSYAITLITVVVVFLLSTGTDIWDYYESDYLDASLTNSSNDSKKTDCLPGGLPDSLPKLRMLYDNVETFVMFIGYPRSSHSLVGSILDAHPEIIIPHEYHIVNQWDIYRDKKIRDAGILKYLLFYNLHSLSTWQAAFGNRAAKPIFLYDGMYSYNVPGSWQGTFKGKIKVIGDKKGGGTTMELCEKPEKFAILKELNETLGVPLKFLHVVRNPFDIISTWVLRQMNVRKMVKDGKVFNKTALVDHFIKSFFDLVETNEKIRQIYGDDSVLDILNHELLSKPHEIMKNICVFINISCNEEYLQQVSKILYGKPSRTRESVVWTEQLKQRLQKGMQKYYYLRSFNYEGE